MTKTQIEVARGKQPRVLVGGVPMDGVLDVKCVVHLDERVEDGWLVRERSGPAEVTIRLLADSCVVTAQREEPTDAAEQ